MFRVLGGTSGAQEIQVEGNVDGLLALAEQILTLALTNKLSSHIHVDGASICREDSVPAVISRIGDFGDTNQISGDGSSHHG